MPIGTVPQVVISVYWSTLLAWLRKCCWYLVYSTHVAVSFGPVAFYFLIWKPASPVANPIQPPLHFTLWITLVDYPMKLRGWLTYEKRRVEKEVTTAPIWKKKKKNSQHATEKNPLVDRFDTFSAGTLHCCFLFNREWHLRIIFFFFSVTISVTW